ncbi:cytochrome P450 [Ornithinicoccus halotolerans]|uniref:cytochrome P450 n=1 Tax=Ornithinicoccus halotolerans TaxID=1748220 RepID=UPI001296833C|nr:cytochrome P450 [Ornithinicoccus halotolerans]
MPTVPTTSAADGVRALSAVVLPVLAKGPIVRRAGAVNAAERLDLDTRAVTEMQRLRERYGPGPVQVRLPGRRLTLLLEPADVHRVLHAPTDEFSPATREKRGALGHFQPDGVLVSSPEERLQRRPFNEEVLQTGRTVHSHGEAMTIAVREEVAALLGHLDFAGSLDWPAFHLMFWRVIRRVVLGDSARDDVPITSDLDQLRADANWSFLRPTKRRTRERFLQRLQGYIDRAEPGSLAQLAAVTEAADGTKPHQQLPQWLFAFDAATWASARALALLASDGGVMADARAEAESAGDPPDLPRMRAVILESLRLWPTTPLVLRDTLRDTEWAAGTLPAGASVVVFAPFFHRDETRVPEAHRFAPDLWLRERTEDDWPLVPFSAGPAMCPGRNLVLLVASAVLGELVRQRGLRLQRPLDLQRLPGLLSPFRLSFEVS